MDGFYQMLKEEYDRAVKKSKTDLPEDEWIARKFVREREIDVNNFDKIVLLVGTLERKEEFKLREAIIKTFVNK